MRLHSSSQMYLLQSSGSAFATAVPTKMDETRVSPSLSTKVYGAERHRKELLRIPAFNGGYLKKNSAASAVESNVEGEIINGGCTYFGSLPRLTEICERG